MHSIDPSKSHTGLPSSPEVLFKALEVDVIERFLTERPPNTVARKAGEYAPRFNREQLRHTHIPVCCGKLSNWWSGVL